MKKLLDHVIQDASSLSDKERGQLAMHLVTHWPDSDKDTLARIRKSIDQLVQTNDEMVEPSPPASIPKKSKWATIADQMANENLLDGELGETIENNGQVFRANFAMRTLNSD
jgi:hypothetical protein